MPAWAVDPMEPVMDKRKPLRNVGLVLAMLALCHCARPPATEDAAAGNAGTASAPAVAAPVFEDARLGLAVQPVPGMQPRAGFRRDYLAADAWKADAGPDSHGSPLFALVLDGSNEVTAAELRIGRSDAADAVAGCTDVPGHARPAGGDMVEVDGVPFRHFFFSDAAMSHYLEVEAYRAVRDGQCLAIDLLVAGTRPEVYDPPRQPPFDAAAAKAKLRDALAAIRFGD
jgi:hypothetical protein